MLTNPPNDLAAALPGPIKDTGVGHVTPPGQGVSPNDTTDLEAASGLDNNGSGGESEG